MDQDQRAVLEGVIRFPVGTNVALVKEACCSSCILDCEGIKSHAGEMRAVIHDDKISDERIIEQAPCLQKKES